MVVDHQQGYRLAIYDCGFGGADAGLTLKGYFKNDRVVGAGW